MTFHTSSPFVSIIIPVRNEKTFIKQTLDALIAQDYPSDHIEIIVADGMSDDGTRDIVRSYTARYPYICLIDNPDRITPSGLNAAIAIARGEIISRVDGHCEVAPDFISQIVRVMREHPEAWVVGGPIVHRGAGAFGEAVAIAMSHPFGVGNARHRFPNFEGYVETVQFPAFRRWVFDRIEVFDTTLVRTEDDELNYRIVQAGGRLFVSPKVRYVYHVRNRPGSLFKQHFQYSFWRIPVMRKHKRPTTVRQIIPLLFFCVVLVLLITGVMMGQPLLAAALPLAYAGVISLLTALVIRRRGLSIGMLTGMAVITMHLAYALGMAYGFVAAALRVRAWDINGSMSALSR